ncbi:MAG: hypothetical protein ACKO8I_11930, partial [Cyanobacteriota bacterium]
DDPEALAASVLELHGSQTQWQEMREAALSHVSRGWGAEASRRVLRSICVEVGLPVPADDAQLGEALAYRPDLVRQLGPDELLASHTLNQRL